MKKLKFLSYLFAALLMVTLVSCDDDDDDATPDKEALLTAGVWTGSKIYYQGVDVTEDFSAVIDIESTSIRFNKNGTYTVDFDGDTENGTWEYTNNQTQILMDKGTDDELTADVNRLSTTELWLEGDFAAMGDEIEIRFVR